MVRSIEIVHANRTQRRRRRRRRQQLRPGRSRLARRRQRRERALLGVSADTLAAGTSPSAPLPEYCLSHPCMALPLSIGVAGDEDGLGGLPQPQVGH